MKTALITTTINVPRVLALYRKHGEGVRFFVAGDQKVSEEAVNYCTYDLPNTHFIYTSEQDKWRCSELIGWNCIQRRNIALLEAVKWGAELIITIDDDNIPVGNYFCSIENVFSQFRKIAYEHRQFVSEEPKFFSGLKVATSSGWFDSGSLLVPSIKQRGFPGGVKSENVFDSAVDAKIGVASGLILGDSDMDAVTRIASAPLAYGVSEMARAGIVTDPKETWTPFNTQNTAFLRELAPAMFCAPGLGRHDDIFASLITQRIMREHDLFVHVGQPFVYQQRNQHDLLKDLSDELFGMRHILKLANFLDRTSCSASTPFEFAHHIYSTLPVEGWYPSKAAECVLAFLDDMETVL